MSESSLVRRIAERLWQAEVCEPNPQYQADLRISYITVLYAARGVSNPRVHATRIVLGLHPDKVWPMIIERRKALLGKEYSRFYDSAGNWIPDPLMDPWLNSSPRKPMGSVRLFPKPPEEDAA